MIYHLKKWSKVGPEVFKAPSMAVQLFANCPESGIKLEAENSSALQTTKQPCKTVMS